ncbi:MAG: protein-ADP-ribose hydrolase [Desulfopila sp.]
MNQEERLTSLIDSLRAEPGRFSLDERRYGERRQLLRALMNVRPPGKVDPEYIGIQDAYLQEEIRQRGIVEINDIPTIAQAYHSDRRFAEKISLWQGDITRIRADAIVNAANSRMLGCFVPCHGCIDNVIHSLAGIQLREECDELMRRQNHHEPTGSAKITGGYNLPCTAVLHTVGPVVRGKVTDSDRQLLAGSYASCLRLAEERGVKSIVFCCISTGEFGFDNEQAAEVAVATVEKYLARGHMERIVFNVFKDKDLAIYQKLLGR